MANEIIARRCVVAAGLVCAGALYAQNNNPDLGASPSPVPANATPEVTAGDNGEVTDLDWKFVTRLTAIVTYDDNLFIQPQHQAHDVYFHFAPSLAVGIGTFRDEIAPFAPIPHLLALSGEEDLPRKDYVYASYTPDAVVFSRFHHEDTVNHDLRLAARKERDLWYLQGLFHVQSVRDIDIDVGQRLRQTYYTLDASGWHALTGKTDATLGIYAVHSDYSGTFASSTDLRGTGGLEYQIAPKTAIGVAAAFGYLDVASGGNQTYQQPLLQVRYNPTGKLSFTGRFGEEFRQYASNVPHRSRFAYYSAANYQASEDTTFTFSGERDTTSSAQYVGQNIVADTFQGSLRQRIFVREFITAAGGYVHDRYENNRVATAVNRRDNYYFGRIAASRDVTKHGTIELSYEHRRNDSTLSPFGFDQNVASLSASFMY